MLRGPRLSGHVSSVRELIELSTESGSYFVKTFRADALGADDRDLLRSMRCYMDRGAT
ncbi:MAG: hypothetical protein Q6370_022665 [Candidatus Sigynarchaeota archaeon]